MGYHVNPRCILKTIVYVTPSQILVDLGLGPEDVQDFLLRISDAPDVFVLMRPSLQDQLLAKTEATILDREKVHQYLIAYAEHFKIECYPAHIDMIWSYLETIAGTAQLVCIGNLGPEEGEEK